MRPYYDHGGITLFCGDCREILPSQPAGDCVLADPPYGITSLKWDKWPTGWLESVRGNSLWCFGKLRVFMERSTEFELADWKLSQELIWEKQNGSGFAADRFKSVHENIAHFYRGQWRDIQHSTPRIRRSGPSKSIRKRGETPHHGSIGLGSYKDDGFRLVRSVLQFRNGHGFALNETQKPVALLKYLLRYACPDNGLVIVPFAGSGSELVAAKQLGLRAIGVELRESECENAAQRLSQEVINFEVVS